MKPRPLTSRQRAFVEVYATCRNATEAARRAGYSARTAYAQGARLLKNVEVRTALSEFEAEARADAMMEYQEACERLTAIARGSVAAILDERGAVHIPLLKDHSPAVQTVDVRIVSGEGCGNVAITRVRFHDPIRAIERLARLRGWDAPQKSEIGFTSLTDMLVAAGMDEAEDST